jgi:hypothetical protein
VQTFDFDLNRSEEAKEKEGGIFFYYGNNNLYLLPTISVNIGHAATAANNNIITQLTLGKALRFTKDKAKTEFLKIAIEVSPTYNTDKDFKEKLYYGQVKIFFFIFGINSPVLPRHRC